MANLIRLNRTLAHIEANLSLWNQAHWVSQAECGTAYCFAGWALQLENIRICTADCDTLEGAHVHRTDIPGPTLDQVRELDDILSVRYVARVVLGLQPAQAWNLFCAGNSLADLRMFVNHHNKREASTCTTS